MIPEKLKEKIKAYIEKERPTIEIEGEVPDNIIKRVLLEGNPESLYELEMEVIDNDSDNLFQIEAGFKSYLVEEFIDEFLKAVPEEEHVSDMETALGDELEEDFEIFPYSSMDKAIDRSSAKMLVVLFSNYDCINSHHFESSCGPYDYYETYFGDMVDFLRFNPKKLREIMMAAGIECTIAWPDVPTAEPLVDYDKFIQELVNSCTPVNLWTIPVSIPLRDILDNPKPTSIRLKKGTTSGLFSWMHGGGSMMECSILRDVELKLGQIGDTEYDALELRPHDFQYTIQQVYGIGDEIYTSATLVTKAFNKEGDSNES